MATDSARQAHRVNGSSSSTHGRTNSTRSSGSGGGSSSENPTPLRSSGSRSRGGPSGGVESAVTRLLVAIKQLLESLTNWSTKKISEQDVSDVYVRLGNDFNACVVAFASFDIDMRELRGVPEDLRHVLETCLAEDANPETLERFLPQVREIITDLLQGLRNKQSQFRAMTQDRAQRRAERQNSTSTTASGRHMRSGSKPRPLPAPQILEEEPTPPPLPSEPIPPPVQAPPPQSVASAIPGRMSLGRRKHSGSVPRAQSPLSLMSDGDGARAGPSIATSPRKASVNASSIADTDGLAELAANASATEEKLRSPAPRKVSLVAANKSTPERDQAAGDLSSDSIASSATVTPGLDDTPPKPPKPLPPVSPDVKRYSLIDKPIGSPPPSSGSGYPFPNTTPSSSSAPSFAVVSATPSPPLPSGSTAGVPSAPESPLDPALTSQEPAVESSIVALQKSDVLERKASKRFSSYTFTKMAGGAAGLGTLKQMGSSKNLNRRSIAPSTSIGQLTTQDLEALAEVDETRPVSPMKRNSVINLTDGPERRGKSPIPEQAPPVPSLPEGAKSSPLSSRGTSPMRRQGTAEFKPPADKPGINGISSRPGTRPSSPTPQPLTVFLQVGRHVKKVNIDQDSPLSFASLRVLFVDKFAYNPGQDNFPAIYIRDANSGVQYEMEDIDEVKDGCLLSLNIEPLDQVKQHIDLQMATLTGEIKDLRSAINAQKRQSLVPGPLVVGEPGSTTPQAPRPTDQQFNLLARRLSRLRMDDGKGPPINLSTPKPLVEQTTGGTFQPLAPQTTGGSSWTFSSDSGSTVRIVNDLKTQFDEIQNLRRDLGVMRQLYLDFIGQTKESLGALRTQTANVKDLANAKVGGARSYINSGKTNLDTRTQTVLTKVEELQDTVESLKDDVLKRHVSPKSSIMKTLTADIAATKAELESLKEHIATVKPMWKKTWEEELQNIVDEQGFLTHQEEFVEDLIEDYKALTEVFGHVEKIVSVRNATMTTSGMGRGGRVMRTGKQFRPPPPEPGSNGLSTVMLEIRAAQPDPAKRLKAIEANQKARHKELMSRSNEFQEELGDFVSGRKLKKTGGIEETERLRQARNDYTLKNMFSPATGGVAGGGMVNAGTSGVGSTGSPTKAGGGNTGAGLGMGGVTFAQAPPIEDSDDDEDDTSIAPAPPPARKSGGFFSGLAGLTFSKAPDLPDSP